MAHNRYREKALEEGVETPLNLPQFVAQELPELEVIFL